MMCIRLRVGVLGVAILFLGCGESDSKDSEIPTTASASCKEWQDELLAFIDRCTTNDASDFEEQTRSIHCTSDDAALACVSQLESASCSAAGVAGCDVTDLADREEAQAKCASFLDTYCAAAVGCGEFASADECLAGQTIMVDCTQVIGWTHDLDACVSSLEDLSCSAAAAPPECELVFIAEQ